jgi:hypothetical protein
MDKPRGQASEEISNRIYRPDYLHRPLQGTRCDLDPWAARHLMLLHVLGPDSVDVSTDETEPR